MTTTDPVRYYADHCLSKTMQVLPESPLYTTFFTVSNYNYIVQTLQQRFDVMLEESYRHDVLDAMIKIFTYHPRTLDALNDLVLIELTPKIQMLKTEQERYRLNILENQTTHFLHVLEYPESTCKRKESLSFLESMFGTRERNVEAFRHLQTGL